MKPGGQNYRSSRCGYEGRTELTEVPVRYKNVVPVPRVLGNRAYRTYRSSGYEYEGRTELTEVPGTGIKPIQNSQKFRVLWHGRTELTEVPAGIKMVYRYPGYCGSVARNFLKFGVRV